MNKEELIRYVADKVGIAEDEVERVVTTTFYVIYEEIAKGREVSISGFGDFSQDSDNNPVANMVSRDRVESPYKFTIVKD